MLFLIANYFFYTIVLNFKCYVHKFRLAQPVYTQYRVDLILHRTLQYYLAGLYENRLNFTFVAIFM
jgi:hypothetical protein